MAQARKASAQQDGGLRPWLASLLRLAHATAFGAETTWRDAYGSFLESGGSSRQVAELLALLSQFCGWPVCLSAFAWLLDAEPSFEPARSARPRTRALARKKGLRLFRRVYGENAQGILSRIGRYDQALSQLLIEVPYGEIYARSGLSLRTKETIACLLLAAMGKERELRGHLGGAIRCGVPKAQLRAALRMVASMSGRHRSDAALAALDQVLAAGC